MTGRDHAVAGWHPAAGYPASHIRRRSPLSGCSEPDTTVERPCLPWTPAGSNPMSEKEAGDRWVATAGPRRATSSASARRLHTAAAICHVATATPLVRIRARPVSARAACSAAWARVASCWASRAACSACPAAWRAWSRAVSAALTSWPAWARAWLIAASRSASAAGPGGGVSAGRLDSSGPVVFGGGAGCLGLLGAGLGAGEPCGDFLCGGVGLRAPLVGLGGVLLGGGGAGFGGGGALLGGRADGFDLGFGGGRVGCCLDGVAQPGGDVGDPVGFGAQEAQQFRAGDPGHGHRCVGVGRAGRVPGRRGGQAAASPGGDLLPRRPSQYSGGRPGPADRAAGAVQPGRITCLPPRRYPPISARSTNTAMARQR